MVLSSAQVFEILFGMIKTLRLKFFETMDERRVALRTFQSQHYVQARLDTAEVQAMLVYLAPQKYLSEVVGQLLSGFFGLFYFTLKDEKPSFFATVNKNPRRPPDQPFRPKLELKAFFYSFLGDLMYFSRLYMVHVYKIIGCLFHEDQALNDRLVLFLLDQLDTVGSVATSVAEQYVVLKTFVKLFKGLCRLSPEAASAAKRRVRGWLLNIGTNSSKKALFHFYIEQSEEWSRKPAEPTAESHVRCHLRIFTHGQGMVISLQGQL